MSYFTYKLKIVLLLSLVFIVSGFFAASNAASPVRSMQEIRHKNLVLQQWELSCASAALATVLRYQHGYPATERSVALGMIKRTEYLSNPDLLRLRQGFSLLDLKRFVDTLDFQGDGLGQLEFKDLLEHAPIIVPVNLQGYPHFVVFRGATDRQVLLADPAFGNITVPIDKFVDGWIKYQNIGHVGFVVKKGGRLSPPGRLSASAKDFISVHPGTVTLNKTNKYDATKLLL